MICLVLYASQLFCMELVYNEEDQEKLYKRWIHSRRSSLRGIDSQKNSQPFLVFLNTLELLCAKLKPAELNLRGVLKGHDNFYYPIIHRNDSYQNKPMTDDGQKLLEEYDKQYGIDKYYKVETSDSTDENENEEWNDPINAFFRGINQERNRKWALQQLKNKIGYTQSKKRSRHKKKLWGNNYQKTSYNDRLQSS